MDELNEKEILEILEKYMREDTNIPKELLDDFKERLVDVIKLISEEVTEAYESEDEMMHYVKDFFDKLKEKGDPTVDSQIFLVVDVPILIPVEVFALCLLIHRDFLTATMAQVSEFLINGVLSHIFKSAELYKLQETMLMGLMRQTSKKEVN